MMYFDEFLTQKKIDAERFRAAEPAQYTAWKVLFDQVNPESFTAQKKFLLNRTRRAYLLV